MSHEHKISDAGSPQSARVLVALWRFVSPLFMDIRRAGKQTKAFWRAEEKHAEKAAADPMLVVPANTAHHFDVERRRSFAAGWTAGVNYLRRQRGG